MSEDIKKEVEEEDSQPALVDEHLLLPTKSAPRYNREYADFKRWQKNKNIIVITEDVILDYFAEISKKFTPNSLGSKWSMLKSCFQQKENVRADRFYKVTELLKRNNTGYVPKKGKELTKEQIERFLLEAPDVDWLLYKIITIFFIFGSCKCDELLQLTLDDIEDIGIHIIVTIKRANNTPRRFLISDNYTKLQPCRLYRQYIALRPSDSNSLRFFLTYRKGKCIAINAGYHTIANTQKQIATYLQLDNPELYAGHSFRRIAASMYKTVDDEHISSNNNNNNNKNESKWRLSASYEEDITSVEKIEEAKVETLKCVEDADEVDLISIGMPQRSDVKDATEDTSSNTETGRNTTFSKTKRALDHISISNNSNCTLIFNIYERKPEFSKL